MTESRREAPGQPGREPRWNSGAKCGVGTASDSATSPVWYTLAQGVLQEIFYPAPDTPCTRDLSLIVTDGKSFFSDEQVHAHHETAGLLDGVPAYRLLNTCRQGRYRIGKTVFSHPRYPVVVQETRFTPLDGVPLGGYRLYVLLTPHLGGSGHDNSAWVDEYKGQTMLFARRDRYALALASSSKWLRCSAGFDGVSDGRQRLQQDKCLSQTYDSAPEGNVTLIGEIDLAACQGEFVLALGFGPAPAEAAHCARASLLSDLSSAREEFVGTWRRFQDRLEPLQGKRQGANLYRTSTAVMRVHEDKTSDGMVASLSVPWGMEVGDDDRLRGGYHLAWPRDLVETAGGLLAAGARDDALRRLSFLQTIQEADGHWAQNLRLNGEPFWKKLQLCQTGLPILLLNLLLHHGLDPADAARFLPMVERAAGFIVRRGPTSDEGRWEREPGYTPFTVAVVIAALLAAADLADAEGNPDSARLWRETADGWNARIEGWLYVKNTELAARIGVEGYYARVLRPADIQEAEPDQECVRFQGELTKINGIAASEVVSPDALALVRYGLRRADDPRIINTVTGIDSLLRVDMPCGPAWKRFNGDDYGEKSDGSPFPGHHKGGIGRPWPLLTGERAHFELAAGRFDEAQRLLHTLEVFASDTGFLPEQVWDANDIAEHNLYFGRATGSAMPLAWAHSEYVKLLRSLRDGRVFDMPPQTAERYLSHARASLPAGRFSELQDSPASPGSK